jgi:integrase
VRAPGIRFHDLRHTHATLMLRASVPVDAVGKRLGHASPVVTMQVYAHVLEYADSAAVERLEKGLGAAISADLLHPLLHRCLPIRKNSW